MNISILTLFPDLYQNFLETSLIGRARARGDLQVELKNLFEYCAPGQRIDSPTFGPGAGMVLRPDVVAQAIEEQEQLRGPAVKVFFSPQGDRLDQRKLKALYKLVSKKADHLLLFASRYEGIDVRVEQQYADELISIGDFVLMGGDLPSMMLLEGILRYLPGVVGRSESVEQDSFTGPFVDYPEYTQPVVWQGISVPEIVRSGNHQAIANWRAEQAAKRTVMQHFGWLQRSRLKIDERELAAKFIPSHYVALLHSDVLIKDPDSPDGKRVGTSSVTSFDIHDIARSSLTYGLKNFFIVTPLKDQQLIVKTLLDFWHAPVGIKYNQHRHRAVSRVILQNNLDEVIAAITKAEGQPPLLVGTSARELPNVPRINFYQQSEVWRRGRPILFLFGTAGGIAPHIMQRCDYVLESLGGFSNFNHLSVRAAAAIVFDRWLGINIKD